MVRNIIENSENCGDYISLKKWHYLNKTHVN